MSPPVIVQLKQYD